MIAFAKLLHEVVDPKSTSSSPTRPIQRTIHSTIQQTIQPVVQPIIQSSPQSNKIEFDANYISREDMVERIVYWKEFWPNYGKFKFSPYGVSSLHVPPFHRENLKKIASEAKESDFQYNIAGRHDLKESILHNFPPLRYFNDAGHKLMTGNILITSGVIPGISVTIEALCFPGDEVIMFEPIYPYHLSRMIIRNDIRLKVVRMKYNRLLNQFEFDYDALKKALSPRTKILLITNPNNPTTKVFTREEYLKIADLIEPYPKLKVIEDCAYFLYHEDKNAPVPFGTIRHYTFDKTITFYSAGQMFNVTGLRLGFAVCSHELQDKIFKYFAYDLHIVPAFEQMVIRDDLISAQNKFEGSSNFYDHIRKDIVSRARRVEKELSQLGINFLRSEGTHYLILDIESLRGKIQDKYYQVLDKAHETTTSLDKAFSRMLFLESYIGALPLSCLYFGNDAPDNFVRVSLNRNDADLETLIDAVKDLKLY